MHVSALSDKLNKESNNFAKKYNFMLGIWDLYQAGEGFELPVESVQAK